VDAQDPNEGELEQIRQERDLYLSLLQLGAVSEIPKFLDEALALVVSVTGARQGYIEIEDTTTDSSSPLWSTAQSCSSDEVADIRDKISRGIIAEARAKGGIVSTDSALLDPRFEQLASVQAGQIDAVLCAPIGGERALGVVYLRGRDQPGTFDADDKLQVEIFAAHLGPLAESLLDRHEGESNADATALVRRRIRCESIVGRSKALAEVLEQIALVAPLDIDVLLTGESGTGKTQLARVIHENSDRAHRPFVELNCAAISESLIENELFGHVAGAFTDARGEEPGRIAAAEGGTLLLDEVGDLPLGSQAKLLQLLQSKTYFRVGSSDAVKANIRIIAATNVDLLAAIERKTFRRDLFYRLDVLPIWVSQLSKRRGDIDVLAAHFCASACARHGFGEIRVSLEARRALNAAEWPGNVRQLAFTVERAVIRAAGEGATEVRRLHVFPDGAEAEAPSEMGFQEATRRFQAEFLSQTLSDCDWNVTESAKRLEIARSHVYNLINAFGLERAPKR